MFDKFDCVVMLTMSNWHTEPRSNRFHYASRFSKVLPTFFVQFDNDNDEITIEKTEYANLSIVHVPKKLCEYTNYKDMVEGSEYDDSKLYELERIIKKIGGKRWLIWNYNPYVSKLLSSWDMHFRVHHATEIYLVREPLFSHTNFEEDYLRMSMHLRKTFQYIDLVIPVSSGVIETINSFFDYKGEVLPLFNGCDDKFWINPKIYQKTSATTSIKNKNKKNSLSNRKQKTIFYQGAINNRLDYILLNYVASELPNWRFVFCGQKNGIEQNIEANNFFSKPNVEYLGNLAPEKIRKEAGDSDVAIIPFRDAYILRKSLPLKAYEYVACGLPVVTTMVDDLCNKEDIFHVVMNKEKFVEAIRKSAKTRYNEKFLEKRLLEARKNSYDSKFKELGSYFKNKCRDITDNKKLNILVLYCDKSTSNRGLRKSLESIKDHSKHEVFFLPATTWGQQPPYPYTTNRDAEQSLREEYGEGKQSVWNFNMFDAVVVHYSVRLTFDFIFSDFVARNLHAYKGAKLLYLQDEYEKTEMARKWMDILEFDVIYTCVPEPYIDTIYPKKRFQNTQFKNVLTGYVTADLLSKEVVPLHKRRLAIAYRGRKLSHRYGMLGYEKRLIGIKMKEYANNHNIPVDIEWDDKHRIYDGWLEFLSSARVTLATESGSNMFDFDGNLQKKAIEWSDVSFEEAYEEYFETYDDTIKMAQVSPKIFEAISLKTALVCFEGEYSGVIKPNLHYIPLKKDFSNIESVFNKIMDDDLLKRMTERAYKDIILSNEWSIEENVSGLMADIESLCSLKGSYEIITAPIAIKMNNKIIPLQRTSAASFLLNNTPFNLSDFRQEFLVAFEGISISSKAVSNKAIENSLLYNDMIKYSAYDQYGNYDYTLRETRLDALLNSKFNLTNQTSSSHNTLIPDSGQTTNAQVANSALPTSINSKPTVINTPEVIKPKIIRELENILNLRRYKKLKHELDVKLSDEALSLSKKTAYTNHILDFFATVPSGNDDDVAHTLVKITEFYKSNLAEYDIEYLYLLEFILRREKFYDLHANYIKFSMDTLMSKEVKFFESRLYFAIYYYFQLYYKDEKMLIVQKEVNSSSDNLYKRMIKFVLSQANYLRDYDKNNNVDNSYMIKLFADLSKPSIKQNLKKTIIASGIRGAFSKLKKK
jgi:hypothetical protein